MVSPLRLPEDLPNTVDDILSLMTRRPLDWPITGTASVRRVAAILELCNRWKSEHLLERVKATIRDAIEKERHQALYVFICAVVLDDHEICKQALPAAACCTWNPLADADYKPGQGSIDKAEVGQSALDIVAMPLSVAELIPYRNRIALGRAYRLRGEGKKGRKGDWEKVALRVLQAHYGTDSKSVLLGSLLCYIVLALITVRCQLPRHHRTCTVAPLAYHLLQNIPPFLPALAFALALALPPPNQTCSGQRPSLQYPSH